MPVHDDAWLSGVFGHPVYKVDVSEKVGEDVAAHLAARTDRSFYFAKVDTGCIAEVAALGSLGFVVVDVNVTLAIDGGGALRPPREARIDVGDYTAAEVDAVLDIAGSAFRYSRFHLDPLVPDAIANRVKREWIANYARGARGETLMVARDGGRPVGFLAVLASGQDAARVRTIDLIAVDRAAQGRGAGRALVSAFIERYAPTSRLLQVGTQVANVPSLVMYQKLGFTIRQSTYVMHCHRPPAGRS